MNMNQRLEETLRRLREARERQRAECEQEAAVCRGVVDGQNSGAVSNCAQVSITVGVPSASTTFTLPAPAPIESMCVSGATAVKNSGLNQCASAYGSCLARIRP